jgi:hypothetical protein
LVREKVDALFVVGSALYAARRVQLAVLAASSATGMARLNFPPHVVDKVLNHVSGTIRGVAAIYNRFEYLDERRAALDAWGSYLTGLVRLTTSNVVSLRS